MDDMASSPRGFTLPRLPKRENGADGARAAKPKPNGARAQRTSARLPSIGSMMVVLALVLGIVMLSPTLQHFIQQRQRIAQLGEEVQATEQHIEQLKLEQARWSDPAYIEAQARGRLLFIRPGDTLYRFENSGTASTPETNKVATIEQRQTEQDWLGITIGSFMVAGTSTDPAAGGAQ